MDGLRIDEHSRTHQSAVNHLNAKHLQENGAKTPRRGLGLMINETKTPSSRSQTASIQSTNRKISHAPVYEVFEDVSEKEESIGEKEIEEKVCSSPIEKVSRLSLGHNSFILPNESEDVILHDDVEPLGDEQRSLDMSLAELKIEKWDEYPPIEIASRFENYVEDIRDDCNAEVVSLCESNPEILEWIPSDESLLRMTREQLDQFIDDYQFDDDVNQFDDDVNQFEDEELETF